MPKVGYLVSIVELNRDTQKPARHLLYGEVAEPVLLRFPARQRPALAACAKPKKVPTGEPVAIVLPNWIGDVVMATPALRALREHYGPQAHLIGLAKPYVASVLEGTSWLDETLLYSPRSGERDQHTRAIAKELRQRKVETMIVMNRSLRSTMLAHLTRAKRRIGYGGMWHRLLMQGERTPHLPGENHSPLDCYLNLATAITGLEHEKRVELGTTRDDELAAEMVWSQFGLGQSERVVALNSGSASGDSKHWPLASFSALARRLVERHDCSVLVLCGPNERKSAARIAAAANHPRVHSMADQDLSLGTAKACLRRTDLLVSTDSGPRHIAAAFGVPTVSLMGPMGDHLSRNYHAQDTLLRADVDCAPCGQATCPLAHHRCMSELTVNRVLEAALRKLVPRAARRFAA